MSYISFINKEGQIERIAADGSQRTLLSQDLCKYQFPAWSPDGQAIAAVGREGGDGVVVVLDLESDDSRIVYRSQHEPPFYLYWSPDSTSLTFLTNHEKGGLALHYADVAYGVSETLGLGQPFFWVWHPTEKRILFHTGGGSMQSRIAFLEPMGGYEEPSLTSPGYFQTPGISADGQYLAFANMGARGQSQVVVEHTGSRQRIKRPHQGAAVMLWSPFANQLAYISPSVATDSFFGPLRLLDVASNREEVLVNEAVLSFFWSPNGRYIAYFTPIQQENAFRPITEGYAQGRVMSAGNGANQIWLNLSIVDVFTGAKRLLTPFRPNSQFVNQIIPFFDQYALSHRFWSPKSDAILLPAIVNDEDWLVTVPLNRFPPFPLALSRMGSWSY